MTGADGPHPSVWERPLAGWHVPAALLLIFVALAASSAVRKSGTFDEVAHLTAGHSYWALDDYRLHPENGNLPQRLAALPVVAGDARFPTLEQPAWHRSEVYEIGHQFLFGLGNDARRMILSGRLMILALGIALGIVVYLWARRLFGPVGGALSLTLYAFNPHLLAHARLITSDLSAALFFLLAAGAIWSLLARLTPARLAGSCLAVAGLLLSKMSGVLILPIALILLAVRLGRNEPWPVMFRGREWTARGRSRRLAVAGATAAIHVIAVVSILWVFYGFHYSAFHAGTTRGDRFEAGVTNLLDPHTPIGSAVQLAQDHRLLPEAYLYGFSFAVDQSRARLAFLGGERSTRGWRRFFPYAFAVKTSEGLFLALLFAAAAGIAGATGRLGGGGSGPWDLLYRTAPLWALLGVYWGFALGSHLNIGHRHLLPTYPPLFILAGAAGAWAMSRHRAPRIALAVLLGWVAATGVFAWPDYLAYFNLASGGSRQGYRHLVDSSLDWGQDLPALERWLRRHALDDSRTPVYLSYFGTSSPRYYGIRAQRLPGFFEHDRRKALFALEPGVYCISASMLQLYSSPDGGPWDARKERAYRELAARFGDVLAEAGGELAYRGGEAERFDWLRLERLCAYLRPRVPYEQVGDSILCYQMGAREIEEALELPLVGVD